MAKLYFNEFEDFCNGIEHHLEYMADNGIKEMKVFEAKIETGTGFFFCTNFYEVGEVGQSCGKQCEAYKPLNGKNGRCKHSGYLYEQTDKFKMLEIIVAD